MVQLDEAVSQVGAVGETTYWHQCTGGKKPPQPSLNLSNTQLLAKTNPIKVIDLLVLTCIPGDTGQHNPPGEITPAKTMKSSVDCTLQGGVLVLRVVENCYRKH